jgi:hypothetical protein
MEDVVGIIRVPSCRFRAAIWLGAASFAGADAATINVTSSSTGSNVMSGCALRDAIQAVNTLAAVGQCPAGTNGVNTININVDDLAFTQIDAHSTGAALPALASGRYLNLYGRPQSRTSLSVNAACDGLFSFSWRLLEVGAGAALYVADIDFSHGCPDSSNLGGVGGAIANFGTLYLVRSHLYQNSTFDNALFSSNGHPGAAVYNGPDAQFSATGVVFDSNTGDGALYVDADPDTGFATVDDSTFVNNSGSAIDNHGATSVANSTFVGNIGLAAGFTFTAAGGAILNNGTLGLSFASLLHNSVQGGPVGYTELDLAAGSTTWIRSTLFGTLTDPYSLNCRIADGASVAWSGVSISRDATCAGGSNLVNTDPGLDAGLADNGGSTPTLKLLTGSPALHRDNDCLDAYGDPVSVDQRGTPRPPRRCDAGAFNDTIFIDGLQ